MNKRNVRRALTRGFKLIFAGALAVFMMALRRATAEATTAVRRKKSSAFSQTSWNVWSPMKISISQWPPSVTALTFSRL